MLGNLPPYLRSKTNNVRLLALWPEEDLELFEWDLFLDILLKDLIILETVRIKILLGDQEITFKGTVVFIYGDNLGSNYIGGFTVNFCKSYYFCRFCKIYQKQLLSYQWYNVRYRIPESYDECARKALRSNSMIKGIKINSCLNKLLYYNV